MSRGVKEVGVVVGQQVLVFVVEQDIVVALAVVVVAMAVAVAVAVAVIAVVVAMV